MEFSNYLEHIYEWGAFLEHLWMGVCGCDCLEHIFGWVWVGVTV